MWDAVYPYLAALLPTLGILLLFYVVIRNLLTADRQERKAQAQWHGARAGLDGPATADEHGFVPEEGERDHTKALGDSSRISSDDSGQDKHG